MSPVGIMLHVWIAVVLTAAAIASDSVLLPPLTALRSADAEYQIVKWEIGSSSYAYCVVIDEDAAGSSPPADGLEVVSRVSDAGAFAGPSTTLVASATTAAQASMTAAITTAAPSIPTETTTGMPESHGDHSAATPGGALQIMQLAMSCSMMPKATCGGDCEWSKEESSGCQPTPEAVAKRFMGPGPGYEKVKELIGIQRSCSDKKQQGQCVDSCEWHATSSQCTVAELVALRTVGGSELEKIGTACHALSVDACSVAEGSSCYFERSDKLCRANPVAALDHLGLSRDHPAVKILRSEIHCRSKAQETCADDVCSWDKEELACNMRGELVMAQFMGGGGDETTGGHSGRGKDGGFGGGGSTSVGDGAGASILEAAMICALHQTAQSCTGTCVWDNETDKCAPDPKVMIAAALGGKDGSSNPLIELTKKAALCHGQEQSSCSGDCAWDTDQKKCEVDPIVAVGALGGGALGGFGTNDHEGVDGAAADNRGMPPGGLVNMVNGRRMAAASANFTVLYEAAAESAPGQLLTQCSATGQPADPCIANANEIRMPISKLQVGHHYAAYCAAAAEAGDDPSLAKDAQGGTLAFVGFHVTSPDGSETVAEVDSAGTGDESSQGASFVLTTVIVIVAVTGIGAFVWTRRASSWKRAGAVSLRNHEDGDRELVAPSSSSARWGGRMSNASEVNFTQLADGPV